MGGTEGNIITANNSISANQDDYREKKQGIIEKIIDESSE